MNGKVVLYLAIFFATLAFLEAEAEEFENKLAKKAFKDCADLSDEVKKLNQTTYGVLAHMFPVSLFQQINLL